MENNMQISKASKCKNFNSKSDLKYLMREQVIIKNKDMKNCTHSRWNKYTEN